MAEKENNTLENQPKHRRIRLLAYRGIAGSKERSRRKKIIMSFTIILVTAAGFIAYIYISNRPSPPEARGCSEQTIRESAGKIAEEKTPELVGTVQYIQRQPGYDSDVNCLYILTTYFISVSDAENARKYLDMLKSIYTPEAGYSDILGDSAPAPDLIEQEVAFIEKINNDASSASLEDQVQE